MRFLLLIALASLLGACRKNPDLAIGSR